MKYQLGTIKTLNFGVDVPDEIEAPIFKLKIKNQDQKYIYSKECRYIPLAKKVIAELDTYDLLPSDKNYFIQLELFRDDRLQNEVLWVEQLWVERGSSDKKIVKKSEVKKKVKKRPTFIKEEKPETFESVKQEFLKFVNEQTTVATAGGIDQTHLSGQTRVVGNKDGIITRLSPSAAKYDVKETDDIFIQALDFVSRIDPDLLDDETDLAVYELLDDFLTLSDQIDEAGFNRRVPLSKKIALKRYQRAHKTRIAQRNKNRKKTIAGIIHDKKRKQKEKIGQTASGKRMKKNHIMSKGDHRRTK